MSAFDRTTPEVALMIGIQATGKSSYVREYLFDSHVRINLDMLRTRARERTLFETCLRIEQSCVIDNTNPTREDRSRYLLPAQAAGFVTRGYYFQSEIDAALRRNRERARSVADKGVLGTYGRLELPAMDEGFDSLHYVRLDGSDGFVLEEWQA